ncbi:hypothetical protein D3C77_102480 [compost metagenome]
MQPTEVDDVGTRSADLGDHGAEVLLATGQTFIQHRGYATLGQLGLGCIRQALTVSVLVMQHHDFLALEHVDDVVASDDALLVVTPAHAEHTSEAALGNLWVGRTRGDRDDPGFVIHLGSGNGVGRAEVPHHASDLVLVNQTVGHGHCLLRFTGVIALDQNDLLAVDTARFVDGISRRLGTFHVLLAKRCVGTGHRACYTDLDVGLNIRRNTQRRSYGKGQKAFLVKRLRHEVVLLEFFLVGTTTFSNCSEQGPCHWFFILEKLVKKLPGPGPRPFFTGCATVCGKLSATAPGEKEQPPSAIIATPASVYVQPACNRMRNRTAHPWCATATPGTITG